MPFARGKLAILTRYELAEALRTRRVAMVLVLFAACLLGSFHFSLRLLHRLENQLSATLQLPASDMAGSAAEALWKSARFREIIAELAGGEAIVRELMHISPIALMFGGLAFLFTPMLILLTSSPRIAAEVGTGSVRYACFRCTRLEWAAGKLCGQALLLFCALLVSALGAWALAQFQTGGRGGFGLAADMLVLAGKAWIKGFAFLGLAMGVSQLTRSQHIATALGFVAWIALVVLYHVAAHRSGSGWGRLWELGVLVTPGGHESGLWRTSPAHFAPAALFMLGLGLLYFLAGFLRLRRKDL